MLKRYILIQPVGISIQKRWLSKMTLKRCALPIDHSQKKHLYGSLLHIEKYLDITQQGMQMIFTMIEVSEKLQDSNQRVAHVCPVQ